MEPKFDAAILIGRFQPFHQGHAALLQDALERAGRVLVVIGSAFRARNAKNPFTWEERAAMMTSCLDEVQASRVVFVPVRDYYDDARWSAAVTEGVQAVAKGEGARLALIGFHKDDSSYYLNLFPQWAFLACARQGETDATALRELYFEGNDKEALRAQVPLPVFHFLESWRSRPEFATLSEEFRVLKVGRKKWGLGPFITLDAVVTVDGHVLLVRRKHPPGEGLWAIPGGFLEGRERLLQGAIRELKEETGLSVPDDELVAALRAVCVCDHPDRSQRGRVITHAHWFALPSGPLPCVAGADDAVEARWFPVCSLATMEEALFEDHFMILSNFLNAAPCTCT